MQISASADPSSPELVRRPSIEKSSQQLSIHLKINFNFNSYKLLEQQLLNLQLAIRREQVCESSGYNLSTIGHDSVKEILKIIYR